MALLNQIGGISTGSIASVASGPLAALVGNSTKAFSYQYPENLGNDPSRMHIVKFDMMNVIPRRFSDTGTAAIKSALSTGTAIASGQASATSAGSQVTQSIGSALSQQLVQTSTSVALYMPDTLAMNYNAQYSELSLKEAGIRGIEGIASILGDIGGVTADALNRGKITLNQIASLVDKQTLKAIEAAGVVTGKEDIARLGLKAMGAAINPQLQLIYQGLGFRTFTLEFMFTPKTQNESDQVSSIINAFVYAAHPTVNVDESGMYFTPPSALNLSFFMAQSSNFSDIINSLQRNGNSLVNGIPLGNSITNYLGVASKVNNNRLYKVGNCVLEDINVDYAPNGWSAFPGGAPVQTRLTLSFKETEILDRNRMGRGEVW